MDKLKHTIAKTTLRILEPLIRILLRYEVSHSEFSELAKRSYVDVANKYYSIPNRKQTYSRVSVITGLSRKEVVRLSELDKEALPDTKGPINRANRVIGGWLSDHEFIDENGEPKELPLRGEKISFESLAEKYSGDITGRAILDELIRVGAVVKTNQNTARLEHQGFIPDKDEPETLRIIAKHTSDLMSTGFHNLTHDKHEALFQRQVTYHDLPESVVNEFQLYSKQKSENLLKDFNRWLAERKNTKAEPGEKRYRVGVGIYYFKNDNQED